MLQGNYSLSESMVFEMGANIGLWKNIQRDILDRIQYYRDCGCRLWHDPLTGGEYMLYCLQHGGYK